MAIELCWTQLALAGSITRVTKITGWRKTHARRTYAINLKRQHALNTVIKEPDRLYFMIIFVTSSSSLEQPVG